MENLEEQLKISIRSILNSVPDETVDGIIKALKYVGLESLSDLQFVHDEDLMLVLKPIQRRKLMKAWSDKSSITTPSISSVPKAIPVKQPETAQRNRNVVLNNFLFNCAGDTSTQNTSQDTSTQSIDCRSVTSIDSTITSSVTVFPCTVSEKQLETGSITSSTSSSVTPLPSASSPTMGTNTPSTSSSLSSLPRAFPERSSEMDSLSTEESTGQHLKSCGSNEYRLKVLEVYRKYKTLNVSPDTEDLEVWRKVARELREKFLYDCDESLCRFEIKRQYSNFKKENVTDTPLVQISNISSKKFWKKENCFVLLRTHAKYKEELRGAGVSEKQSLWFRIADEVRQQCRINCNEEQCQNKLKEITKKYHMIRHQNLESEGRTKFLDDYKEFFERTKKSAAVSDAQSNSSTDNFKWTKKTESVLLQSYAKYKAEFTYPDADEQKVWNKIREELKKKYILNCSEVQCRDKINQLRYEYEVVKKLNPTSKKQALKRDAAGRAFETTGNEDSLSTEESTSLKHCNSKEYNRKVLEVYRKYKTLNVSPDTEDWEVWRKVARELREKFLYNCGESLCRFMIFELQRQYVGFKKLCASGNAPYFFEEARNAFETTEMLERDFTIKVSNLPKDVQVSDLQKLFATFGVEHIYRIENETCGVLMIFAFIQFNKEVDAIRAILVFDGAEYNNLILKVELARPTKTSTDSS